MDRNMLSYWMLWIKLIIKYCVSCWITYILQNDTRSIQCQIRIYLFSSLYAVLERSVLELLLKSTFLVVICKQKKNVMMNMEHVRSTESFWCGCSVVVHQGVLVKVYHTLPSVCVSKPGRLIIRLRGVVSDKMGEWLGIHSSCTVSGNIVGYKKFQVKSIHSQLFFLPSLVSFIQGYS